MSALGPNILVADDDPHIREVIVFALDAAGYAVREAGDGAAALAAFEAVAPDLIILDVGMPEMDGLDVCRQIRKSSDVPILFLSARSDEIDRILGLELGADDYVTNPFSARELVTRVGVILKRMNGRATPNEGAEQSLLLTHGVLRLDPGRHEARFGEAPVPLTALEFAMTAALMKVPGQVLSREQLMHTAYPNGVHVSDRTIDSHVRNIRTKFGAVGGDSVVETVHGVGFRLGPCDKDTGGGAA